MKTVLTPVEFDCSNGVSADWSTTMPLRIVGSVYVPATVNFADAPLIESASMVSPGFTLSAVAIELSTSALSLPSVGSSASEPLFQSKA